ncbi:unnamed protein product [Paramecium sonneborni]|uniref:Uncharacterized protein n=1 Tax=Paramecium sonneborni TaxID=65129 RepID=A0A8S1R1E3_9CILI|nr:unnamed protein product [Paramecium sonneborni]
MTQIFINKNSPVCQDVPQMSYKIQVELSSAQNFARNLLNII